MARIFIAFRFPEEFKRKLTEIQDALKAKGVKGTYCPFDNLHMTLVFIGENYDLKAIRKAVNEVAFEPFQLSLSKLGTFPTKEGVIWCGINEAEIVFEIEKHIRKSLSDNGVSFKASAFLPHISLVQHPSFIVTDIAIETAPARIDRIYIMKSERIEGELVYSEIDEAAERS